MGARAEQLASKFDQTCREFTALIDKVSDADWKKETGEEKWSVAATAHHVAGGLQPIAGICQAIAKGQPLPGITMDMIHANNATHAKEFANASKADTLALFKTGSSGASSMVRGLSDAELDKSAMLFGSQPMTAVQAIEGILIGHVQGHMGSIQATLGAK